MNVPLSWRGEYVAIAPTADGDIELRIRQTAHGWWLRAAKRITNRELYRANTFATVDDAKAAAVFWLATQGEKHVNPTGA